MLEIHYYNPDSNRYYMHGVVKATILFRIRKRIMCVLRMNALHCNVLVCISLVFVLDEVCGLERDIG